MPDPDPRLMTIFGEALELADPVARTAYLVQACGEDADLRRRVEALLSAHAGAGRFLEPERTHVLEASPNNSQAATLPPSPSPNTDTTSYSPVGEPTPPFPPSRAEHTGDGLLGSIRYFGDYELLAELARGGMGVVFRARQVSLNREVALKMILTGQLASPADVTRFRTEAEAAANLDHPNVLPIYEIGEHLGQHYFSMKLVQGGSLVGKMAEFRKEAKKAVRMLVKVCRAVDFAHRRGTLHRDLKPGNILLDDDGTPYVTDFGLAKKVESDSNLTQSGAIVGTPNYMAPEQARAEKGLSTGVDVYALGAILYELLTGKPPFRGATVLETILQVLEKDAADPRSIDPRADRDLSLIALKCLEKETGKRYESAAALADDLERWLNCEPIQARPPGSFESIHKWVRRKPAIAALASIIILLMITGSIVSTLLSVEARQKARDAEEAKQLADSRSNELTTTLAHLSDEQKKTRAALDRETVAGYLIRIGRAYADWQANDSLRARRILDDCSPHLRGWEWHYLDRLFHSQLHEWGTDARVRSVVISADGSHIYSTSAWQGSGNGPRLLDCWELTSGKKVQFSPAEPSEEVVSIALLPDGKKLAAGIWCLDDPRDFGPGAVDIFDLSSKKRLHRLEGHTSVLTSVASGRLDGQTIVASASWDKKVLIWNADTGALKLTYEGHSNAVLSVAIAPTGLLAASGGADRDNVSMGRTAGTEEPGVRLWETRTGKDVAVLHGHRGGVCSVAFSPNSLRLATASYDGTARIWNVNGAELRRLQGHRGAVLGVAWSPDNKQIATVGADTTVRLWDVETGREQAVYRGHKYSVGAIAFSPNGKRLISGGGEWAMPGEVLVWDLASQQEYRTITPPNCRHFTFVPESNHILAWIEDKLVLCGIDDGKTTEIMNKKAVEFLPPRLQAWMNQALGQMAIFSYDFERIDPKAARLVPNSHISGNGLRTISDDGSRLIVAEENTGRLVVREVWGERIIATVSEIGLEDSPLVMSPDGKCFAAQYSGPLGAQNQRTAARAVGVFETETGKKLEIPLPANQSFHLQMALSADFQQIAIQQEGHIEIRKIPSGEKTAEFPVPDTPPSLLQFSRDNSVLLYYGGTREQSDFLLWDIQASKERFRQKVGLYEQYSVSPDGKRIARATAKGIFILDAVTGDEILVLRDILAPVAWDQRGQRLFARNSNSSIVVFEGRQNSTSQPKPLP
jgi:serine/threonine protein kinase/WD40 repeat protein